MDLFPTVFLLGLAGFDPMGALIIIAALSMNMSKKQIGLFAAITFIGTVLVGVIVSQVLGIGVTYISELINNIPDIAYMWIGFAIGFLLLEWFVERIFFKKKSKAKEEKKETFFAKYLKKGMFTLGVLFAVLALSDPSFLTLIALSRHSNNLLEVILANCTWITISQLPIFVLTIAIMLNKHEKIIAYFKDKFSNNPKIEKIKMALSVLLSGIILVSGLIMLLDSGCYLIKGHWMF